MPEQRGRQHHMERIVEALKEEIGSIVEGELGDPRIALCTVSEVLLNPDGKSARVFLQVQGDEREQEQTLKGVNAAKNRPNMDQLQQVLQEIEKRSSFVVTSHARPDGDAVGSSLAMAAVLRAMGKKADVVLADPVPFLYQPLPHADAVSASLSLNGTQDAAIVLECDSAQRTRLSGLENYFVISIDHHASSRPWGRVNWIDPDACAVGEMVFRLALAANVTITPEIATCLYTAVLTDTGSFSYSCTNAHTFELARCLVQYGARPAEIAHNIYFSSPLAKMRLLGVALNSLQHENAFTWMSVSRCDIERCGAIDEDCEGLVNYALGIAGVEVAVFFREIANERIRVSIRSKGAVNVAAIAEKFGGGGHECAAGFSLEGPDDVATQRVLSELRSRMPQ